MKYKLVILQYLINRNQQIIADPTRIFKSIGSYFVSKFYFSLHTHDLNQVEFNSVFLLQRFFYSNTDLKTHLKR